MEYNNYQHTDEDILDLKELMLYILRKWRILLLAGVLGVVLGCCTNLLLPEKQIEDFDLAELHLEEIGQYALYQELYISQLQKEKESIYLNLNPQEVHSGTRRYFLTVYDADINRVNEMYNAILSDEQIYFDLLEASGLDCSEMAIQELVSVSFSQYELKEKETLFGRRDRDAKITIKIYAPDHEACMGMMTLLDERVQEINALVQSRYPNAVIELVADFCVVGYDPDVAMARNESADLLATYVSEMEKLEKKLTDDDKLYYSQVYAVEKEEGGLGWLKWGIIVGVVFGGLMVAFYGVMYLMDGHVKTIDELRQIYGLRLIACLDGNKKGSRCALDRLLTTKYQHNSDAYLKSVLAAMEAKAIHICGDMENAQIQERMKMAAGDSGMTVGHRMAMDEGVHQIAKTADGVVLFVQLWKTKHAELVRELEIARHINLRVLGVVVVD